MNLTLKFISSALFFIFGTNVYAAVVLNTYSGLLISAYNVEVDGKFYNVEFTDSNGILSDNITVFKNSERALNAAQALKDQVFLGAYDVYPSLTKGCNSSFSVCSVITPFEQGAAAIFVNLGLGAGVPGDDFVGIGAPGDIPGNGDGANDIFTFARWTVASVPEPETYTMLTAGLGLIGFIQRRRKFN